MSNRILRICRLFAVALLFLFTALGSARLFAGEKVGYPERPSPPRLVNDFAHVLGDGQAQELENRLVGLSRTKCRAREGDYLFVTSCQVSIVTVQSLEGQDINEFSVHVFNDWGLGEKGKENGVLILVALDDGYGKKRAFITVGRGLQGVLTDAKCGNIVRNEMIPHFKDKDYFGGLSAAADAVIAVTKDEYKNDNPVSGRKKHVPLTAIIIIVIVIVMILKTRNRGGGGGGNYMSGGGMGNLAAGFLLGNLLGGRGGGFGGGGGGDSGGFGGFGGFGGGSTDGGGAGGSW